VAAGILILATFVQSMTSEIVSINSLSVPQKFAENGFTAEVASQQLRDALTKFARSTGSNMQTPLVALASELPKFNIPKVDVSIDTVTTVLRNVFHLGGASNISGEFVLQGEKVWLRLRNNGEEIFTGTANGSNLSDIEGLLDDAAPKLMRKIRPYLEAAATYNDDPEWALELAKAIVSRLPSTDPNVQWALILEGKYYLDRHQAEKAEAKLREAIGLNSKNSAAHFNLAIALEEGDNLDSAIVEYQRAIKIQLRDPLPHNNLGQLLQKKHETDEAIKEFRAAAAWDPLNAVVQNNLASALKEKGDTQEAMARYRRAIKIDPKYAKAHYNLGVLLKDQGNHKEAMVEFRHAIENNPNDMQSHIGLAKTLVNDDKMEEAVKEYDLVLSIDPANGIARIDRDAIGDYLKENASKGLSR
jgi:tetratricopeptide (TPR) repeat protein